MKYSSETNIYNVDALLYDTQNLTEPKLYKNFFDDHFLNENDVMITVNEAIKNKAKVNFRIWIDKCEKEHLTDKIINAPIGPNEKIEQWAKRVLNNEKFCILLSQAEQFNDDIAIKLGKFLLPIFERLGMTFGGCNLSFFIGNYGFTPAGVHIDPEEHCIFHFHVGPGYKEILIWDAGEFKLITGSEEPYHKPEEILKNATTFGLNQNDFLSLPPKYYHIGRADQFSIGIAVVLSDCSNMKFTQDVFHNLAMEGLARKKNSYKLRKIEMGSISQTQINESFSHVCIDEKNKNKTFEEVIKSQIEDIHLSLLSNLGWNFPPILNLEASSELSGKKVKLIVPFKIYYKDIGNNKMAIFVRGRELIAQYCLNILKLIDRLNSCLIFNVSELVGDFSEDSSSQELITSFLTQMVRYKALQIIT